ncbi:MAG: glutamate racemase [Polyangiales bacterium]
MADRRLAWQVAAMQRYAIGVFDSGLGGLTVVRAIRKAMPEVDVVYLGDTARVPYGTRSAETVARYAKGCAARLADHGIDELVIACNTASAVALDTVRDASTIPIHGVIEPGAESAIAVTVNNNIGVLATRGTVNSGAYPRQLKRLNPNVQVHPVSASLLVPLAEEGWLEGEIVERVVDVYLEPLVDAKVDTILLGCTHYPLLRDAIESRAQSQINSDVRVVDSADAVAKMLVQHRVAAGGLTEPNTAKSPGELRVLVTDAPAHFSTVASRFLGETIDQFDVELIDL